MEAKQLRRTEWRVAVIESRWSASDRKCTRKAVCTCEVQIAHSVTGQVLQKLSRGCAVLCGCVMVLYGKLCRIVILAPAALSVVFSQSQLRPALCQAEAAITALQLTAHGPTSSRDSSLHCQCTPSSSASPAFRSILYRTSCQLVFAAVSSTPPTLARSMVSFAPCVVRCG